MIGTSVPRTDAAAKIAGQTRFVGDLTLPGMWIGATIRSDRPRGRILAIRRDPAFDWTRVVFLTAADLPGPNSVAMIREDHPILAEREVRFVAEPVALVAAPDPGLLREAVRACAVEIEDLPAVLSIEEALGTPAGSTVIWGADNVLAEYRVLTGEPGAAMATADLVLEGTYRTGHQEHLYLEPNGVIASPRGAGVEILGSLQCPFYVRNALSRGLGLDPSDVVVRQAPTGGAFGGKEDFPSVLSMHAALLALRAGRPVRMIYDRSEDLRSTTKRHPSLVRHRTGVRRDGTLVAGEIDLVLDGGAYTTLSPVVLSRSILHAAGAYRWPHLSIRGRAVATNTPPNGAFRGFGAPQSIFAVERQMDRIARALGLDPIEVRRKNLLRRGDRLPFGQILDEEVGAEAVLERAAALSGYSGKRGADEENGAHTRSRALRGIGLSLFLHGGGFTGAGEEKIAGRARVRWTAEGVLEILVSNVEMGQGASTVLSMIASEALGIPLDRVRHLDPDTSITPDTGPTVASRTTMIVGRIVCDACLDLAAKLRAAIARREGVPVEAIVFGSGRFARASAPDSPASPDSPDRSFRELGSFAQEAARHLASEGALAGDAQYAPAEDALWDEESYRGNAYKAYSWGADVVEVEVDPATLEIRPLAATAVVEIGRAIHPVLAQGQVEGGTLQALGWGSIEEIRFENGRILNDRLATCIIPTALDAPEMRVEIAEMPTVRGAFGAKGLGELPADGGAPALASAVEDATGLVPDELPITPERLLLLSESAARDGAHPSGLGAGVMRRP